MTEALIFACMATPGRSALEAIMLTASLREFGGQYADSQTWVFTPDPEPRWDETERFAMAALGVRVDEFSIPAGVRDFPFGAKVLAAAAAEEKAKGDSGLLVWMDSDSLVVSEPRGLILAEGCGIGCRPVDHTLIGSPWDKPVDPYWELIYRDCGVPEAYQFPITASVDENRIRPYFNAGFLVTRPELGILGSWADMFHALFDKPRYQGFYRDHILYRIFMHQAVLAGVLLSIFKKEEIFWLPSFVNYPLHMHTDYPVNKRPARFEDLIITRYDVFFENPGWESVLPMSDAWKTWLNRQGRVQWGAANRDPQYR